jgi:hypothetical protein
MVVKFHDSTSEPFEKARRDEAVFAEHSAVVVVELIAVAVGARK